MTNLFDLSTNYQQVYDLISSGEDESIYLDTLESINEALEDKADSYVGVIKSLEADNDAITKEIKRLQERKQANTNGIKRLKESLQLAMETTGKTKFKTSTNSFGIQKNAPSLKIAVDESTLPDNYFSEQQPKLDRNRLKDDLKNGIEINGVELVQTESLRIR